MLVAQENHEAILAEKEMEIEMLKDHIEVLLDEQEMANRSHQIEGSMEYGVQTLFIRTPIGWILLIIKWSRSLLSGH